MSGVAHPDEGPEADESRARVVADGAAGEDDPRLRGPATTSYAQGHMQPTGTLAPAVAGGDGTGGDAPGSDPPVDAADPAAGDRTAPPREERSVEDLRPRDVVRRLDDFIVGQDAAKRAVAIALRNRIRRQRLPEALRDEVLPKNILMIGPTGVGKTEIARRLARLTNSPFIKVEATKFTEVGYVGRDVESIVRDLLEQTITDVHDARTAEVEEQARRLAEARIVDSLAAEEERATRPGGAGSPAGTAHPGGLAQSPPTDPGEGTGPRARVEAAPDAAAEPITGEGSLPTAEQVRRRRRMLRRRLERRVAERRLEERLVEVEVEEAYQPPLESFSGSGMEDVGATLGDFFSQLAPPRKRTKRLSVHDARHVLVQEETDRLVDMDRVYDEAIRLVEDDGIVFVDEVDKIAGRSAEHGPDISGEGVQRDLLPLLEGSTVSTRYGSVRTDHILFVAAGAFTVSRPSDLIPEFQGRFPIRVELLALTEADLQRILCEPDNALTKQYAALLGTEGVALDWAPDGLAELARAAAALNSQDENIGARRLFAMVEKVLEEVSFRAEDFAGQTIRIDAVYVREKLADLVGNEDLRRYVL
ncbi:MAG: ATP-dependent protease ATPase subunit HslU [Candidatus Dormibacteria bacterium]